MAPVASKIGSATDFSATGARPGCPSMPRVWLMGLDQFSEQEVNVPRLLLPAIFDLSADRLIIQKIPSRPKMPLWKAAAFAGGPRPIIPPYPVPAPAPTPGTIRQNPYAALPST